MAEIRQRIVSCPHGHCYDANRYSTCPICESVASSPMQNAVSSRGGAGAFPATQDPNSGGSGGGSRFPATQDPYSGGSGGGSRFPATQDPYSGGSGGGSRFPATQDPYSGGSGGGSRFPATQDPYSGGSGGGNRFPATQDPYSGGSGGGNRFPATQDPYSGGSGGGSRFPATQAPYSGGSGGGSRFPATQDPYSGANKASGVTMAPPYHGNSGFNGKMSQTCYVDPSTPAGAPVPVVGWLVAVSGPCRGTDYRIHNGYNYIGREEGDICVHGDYSISAVKDSNVTYVPQTRSFYIAHELGKNVLLVNDVPVIGGAQKLNKNDIVTIGKTKLMFIPMCDEQFSWEDEV